MIPGPRATRAGEPRPSLFEALRAKGANLPHLLETAVQILRDEDLFDVYEEVLREDIEAADWEARSRTR